MAKPLAWMDKLVDEAIDQANGKPTPPSPKVVEVKTPIIGFNPSARRK